MKSIIRRLMLSAAFVMGLAIPLAATWPASAQTACSLLSGSESWNGSVPGSGSFTVSIAYNTSVVLTGTPPPLVSLPINLVSSNGHPLKITANSDGSLRYEGQFTAETQAVCACPNNTCSIWGSTEPCPAAPDIFCVKDIPAGWCGVGICGGSPPGSCGGGPGCTTIVDFKANY